MSTVSRFEIRAAWDADTLPRLLNYFAQRGLAPLRISADLTETTAFIVIEQASLGARDASIIAEKMRSLVLTEEVVLHQTA